MADTFANESAVYPALSLDAIREAVESLPPMPPPNYYVSGAIWEGLRKRVADGHGGPIRFGLRVDPLLASHQVCPADGYWQPVDPTPESAAMAEALRELAGVGDG